MRPAERVVMACGLPVVCSDRGGLRDAGGDVVLHVRDPNDVDGFKTVLAALLNDRDELSRRRRLGLDRAARFTWEAATAKTLAIYNELRPDCLHRQ